MEKEKVLEIEITKINNDWSAITVKKNFINRIYPHIPFLMRNEIIGLLEDLVNAINEKHGIPKRFKPEKYEQYHFITSDGYTISKLSFMHVEDKTRYNLGNCFETEAEAQKIIDSKEWKGFWEKVRAGEIGND